MMTVAKSRVLLSYVIHYLTQIVSVILQTRQIYLRIDI